MKKPVVSTDISEESYERKPVFTTDERRNQLIALAVDEAERRLRDGTASPQIICHYLKLASPREQKELELMEEKKNTLKAKQELIKSTERLEAMYSDAMAAMSDYRGDADEYEE